MNNIIQHSSMVSIFESLLANILFSLSVFLIGILIGLISSSRWLRSRRKIKMLKKLIGINVNDKKQIDIVAPLIKLHDLTKYNDDSKPLLNSLLHWKDVEAIYNIHDTIKIINYEPHIIWGRNEFSNNLSNTSFIIASPLSNTTCAEMLGIYCTGLRCIDKRKDYGSSTINTPKMKGDAIRNDNGVDNLIFGFQIRKSNDNDDQRPNNIAIWAHSEEEGNEGGSDYAVLIKIKRRSKNIHLIFGLTATGTVAAAYYFKHEYESIYKKWKEEQNEQYCFFVKFNRRDYTTIVESDIISYTDRVF